MNSDSSGAVERWQDIGQSLPHIPARWDDQQRWGTADHQRGSGDGGRRWGHTLGVTVLAVHSNWPDVVEVDSGTFLVLADHCGAKTQQINLSWNR
jgi:hypothetical protein